MAGIPGAGVLRAHYTHQLAAGELEERAKMQRRQSPGVEDPPTLAKPRDNTGRPNGRTSKTAPTRRTRPPLAPMGSGDQGTPWPPATEARKETHQGVTLVTGERNRVLQEGTCGGREERRKGRALNGPQQRGQGRFLDNGGATLQLSWTTNPNLWELTLFFK